MPREHLGRVSAARGPRRRSFWPGEPRYHFRWSIPLTWSCCNS